VQARWVVVLSSIIIRIDARLHLTGAEVVELEAGVPLLAAVEVEVRRRAGLGDEEPVGVVVVSVGNRAGAVGQQAYPAAGVVAVVVRCPGARNELRLRDSPGPFESQQAQCV
jgi:hypothetical protein